MLRFLLLSLLAGSAACSAMSGPDPAASDPSAVQAGLRWETQVGGSGVSLALLKADGNVLLRLACTRSPSAMIVTGEAFRAIGSEERLTLGVGDEAYAFVADPTSGRPSGVEARGPVPAGLLDRLATAESVSAAYGTQRVGPHIPPDPDAARTFASGCRAAQS